ncbi:MAG: hypothetical protein ABNH00_11655 [Dokdonia sp.]|jgi:hypothetical protein
MKEKVNNAIDKLIDILEKSKLEDLQEQHITTFSCVDLDELHLIEDIRNSKQFGQLFNKLNSMKGPVLYWFKTDSESLTSEIYNSIKQYKDTKGTRVVPALRKDCPQPSEYVYVGKVKRYFWGRIVQHLGYANDPRTQGLQLFHWSKPIDLKVHLYAIEFQKDMADLVGVLESLMAREFKPIVGSHST